LSQIQSVFERDASALFGASKEVGTAAATGSLAVVVAVEVVGVVAAGERAELVDFFLRVAKILFSIVSAFFCVLGLSGEILERKKGL
jgi:hypothetical protein